MNLTKGATSEALKEKGRVSGLSFNVAYKHRTVKDLKNRSLTVYVHGFAIDADTDKAVVIFTNVITSEIWTKDAKKFKEEFNQVI